MIDGSKIEVSGTSTWGILSIKGDITGDSDGHLRTAYDSLSSEQKNFVILNLSDVEYITSSGIAAIITLYNNINKRGGQLKMAKANVHVAKVLNIVGLSELIPMYATVEDAQKSE